MTLDSVAPRSDINMSECLRTFMDTRIGLDDVAESEDYAQKLILALNTDCASVKKQVFELLSALCVYHTDGFSKVLQALDQYKSAKNHKYRFQLVLEELQSSVDDDHYRSILVAFINCIIISAPSFSDRISLRNELLGLKILEVIGQLRKQCINGSNPDLAFQLDVFDEQKASDEGQLLSASDVVDLNSHMDIFFAILRQVAETSLEMPFLSILQHLLRVDSSNSMAEIVWETAEVLVHRATLLENKQDSSRLLRASSSSGSGRLHSRCHCSCHYRNTTENYSVLEQNGPTKHRPDNISVISCANINIQQPPPPTPYDLSSPQFLTENLFCNSEKECTNVGTENNLRNGEYSPQTISNISSVGDTFFDMYEHKVSTKKLLKFQSKAPKIVSGMHLSNGLSVKSIDERAADDDATKNTVLQINMENTRLCSTENTTSKSTDDESISAQEHSTQLPPVPPPPPPPPPPPLFSQSPIVPPPPPPLPLSSLSTSRPQVLKQTTLLPQQLTPKPKAKMKSFNWSKIPDFKVLGKDNLWSRVAKSHDGKTQDDLDFTAMEELFCQQTLTNGQGGQSSPKLGCRDSPDNTERKKREIQEMIKYLQRKERIFAPGGWAKKSFFSFNSYVDIVKIIVDGEHQKLGVERLKGLLKILPISDEIEMLKNFDGDKTKLGNAEKFLCHLIEVPNYKIRLESMLLKEEFSSSQDYLGTSIATLRNAVTELQGCKKLHEILYMVLRAGNFMNAEGYAGNAAGFKMMSLMKLTDIRANKPSITLLHYVVEQIVGKYPELLKFVDEIENLEEASKISIETLKSDMASLSQRVEHVSDQIAIAQLELKSQMEQFLKLAKATVHHLQADLVNLEEVRRNLADFLCEDFDSFKLEDCFKVFYNFCKRFRAAVQENEKRHQQERIAEARKKQREEQIAMKRRSAELYETNSSNDRSELIIDQLLGDTRCSFLDTKQREVHKKGRKGTPGEDHGGVNKMGSNTQEEKVKRHSDPVMSLNREAGGKTDMQGVLKLVNHFQDETDNRQNSSESAFEDTLFRKSSRRKRSEMLNGDINKRERPPIIPNFVPVVANPEIISEADTKHHFRSKLVDKNEIRKEQEKNMIFEEKQILEKQRRKPYVHDIQDLLTSDCCKIGNHQNSSLHDITNGFSEPIEGIVNSHNARIENTLPCLLNNSVSLQSNAKRQRFLASDRFIKKNQDLLDTNVDEPIKFQRNRLYHSSRDSKFEKSYKTTDISKDDIDIVEDRYDSSRLDEKLKSIPLPVTNAPKEEKASACQTRLPLLVNAATNQTTTGTDATDQPFDRFSSMRKTQRGRQRKLQMRREAENYLSHTSLSNPIASENESTQHPNSNEQCFENNDSQLLTFSGSCNGRTFSVENEVEAPKKDAEVDLHNDQKSNGILEETKPHSDALCSMTDESGQSKLPNKGDIIMRTKQTSNSTEDLQSLANKLPVIGDIKISDNKRRRSSLMARKSRTNRRLLALSTTLSSSTSSSDTPDSQILRSDNLKKSNSPKLPRDTKVSKDGAENASGIKTSSQSSPSVSKKNDQENPVPNSIKNATLLHDKSSNQRLPESNGSTNASGTNHGRAKSGSFLHKITVSTETRSKISVPKSSFTKVSKREPVVVTVSHSTTDMPNTSKANVPPIPSTGKGPMKSSPIVKRTQKIAKDTKSTIKGNLTNGLSTTGALNGHLKRQLTVPVKVETSSRAKQSLPNSSMRQNFHQKVDKKPIDSSSDCLQGRQNGVILNKNQSKSTIASTSAIQSNRKYLKGNNSMSNGS